MSASHWRSASRQVIPQLARAPFGLQGLFLQRPQALAEIAPLRGFLVEPALERGNGRVAPLDFRAEQRALVFRRTLAFARALEPLLQGVHLGRQPLRPVAGGLQLVAQLVVVGRPLVELARETGRQRPFLVERAHRAAERQHHFVERAFQRVEIVELAARVDQQPVQRLAFIAAAQSALAVTIAIVALERCLGFAPGPRVKDGLRGSRHRMTGAVRPRGGKRHRHHDPIAGKRVFEGRSGFLRAFKGSRPKDIRQFRHR